MPPALETRILRAFDRSRTDLPAAHAVEARPNVRRLASLSRARGGRRTLNLSTAVVEAGEEAWVEVAPALEGHRASRDRLIRLSRPGTHVNEARRAARRRSPSRSGARRRVRGRGGRPVPRCQGTPEQRWFLSHLVGYLRGEVAEPGTFPPELHVRISRRMTAALGTCSRGGVAPYITLSERLFRRGLEDVVWETLKHELAHLAHQMAHPAGRSDHGPQWKRWARRLGARPERLCTKEEAERVSRLAPVARLGPLRYPPEVQRWLGATASRDPPLRTE